LARKDYFTGVRNLELERGKELGLITWNGLPEGILGREGQGGCEGLEGQKG